MSKTNSKILFAILSISLIMIVQCDRSTFGIKDPSFEVEEIEDNTYEVEIKAGTNAAIFYTLDGSQPTAQDKRYTEKIKLGKGTHLKAIAICPSGRKSEITAVKL